MTKKAPETPQKCLKALLTPQKCFGSKKAPLNSQKCLKALWTPLKGSKGLKKAPSRCQRGFKALLTPPKCLKPLGPLESALKPLWHLKGAFFDRKCLKALLELFEAGAKVLFLVQSAFLHFRTTCGARVHANGQSKVLFRPPAVVPSARQKHKGLFSQQRGFFPTPKCKKALWGVISDLGGAWA